ncbi:hypothetical protein [Actinokineospora sp. NPDC004072]
MADRPVTHTIGWSCRTVRRGERDAVMADLAYAVLVVGVFAVLALIVRGLERS